ncbi:MAG TPA: DUF6288 domain-containing protein, partial [Luteolibacter sp.]|nr:DUF6288 domain-containing protein [Luteolibacter sp.]
MNNALHSGGRPGAALVSRHLALICSLWIVCLIGFPGLVCAQVPDLTAGGVPTDTEYINLGPTGMEGWIYNKGSGKLNETVDARQILVTHVDAGSPADGILAVNDVILGADGTGAEPVNFTSDARKALAHAVDDAEGNNPAQL